jgi:hypothetical protein
MPPASWYFFVFTVSYCIILYYTVLCCIIQLYYTTVVYLYCITIPYSYCIIPLWNNRIFYNNFENAYAHTCPRPQTSRDSFVYKTVSYFENAQVFSNTFVMRRTSGDGPEKEAEVAQIVFWKCAGIYSCDVSTCNNQSTRVLTLVTIHEDAQPHSYHTVAALGKLIIVMRLGCLTATPKTLNPKTLNPKP